VTNKFAHSYTDTRLYTLVQKSEVGTMWQLPLTVCVKAELWGINFKWIQARKFLSKVELPAELFGVHSPLVFTRSDTGHKSPCTLTLGVH